MKVNGSLPSYTVRVLCGGPGRGVRPASSVSPPCHKICGVTSVLVRGIQANLSKKRYLKLCEWALCLEAQSAVAKGSKIEKISSINAPRNSGLTNQFRKVLNCKNNVFATVSFDWCSHTR